jgi:hypothetical protein
MTTPDRQLIGTDSLIPDGLAMTPESLTESNGDTSMGGMPMLAHQAQCQRQVMTPTSGHMRQPSQLSNGSVTPMTPQGLQQHTGAGIGTSPQQQGVTPFEQRWKAMTPTEQQSTMSQMYQIEVNSMTPRQKQALDQSYVGMPPQQRVNIMRQIANKRMQMVVASESGRIDGWTSAQPSPFQRQTILQGILNSGSPIRGTNVGNMQQSPRQPQMANDLQRAAARAWAFNFPHAQATMAQQIPQALQQPIQMQEQSQQSMQMPEQGQDIQARMPQEMWRSSQMAMNEMQPMLQHGSNVSMSSPGFAMMGSPHMGQMAMPASQAGTNHASSPPFPSFDAPAPSPMLPNEQSDESLTGQEAVEDVLPVFDFDVPGYLSADVQSDGSHVASRPAGSQLVFGEIAHDDFASSDGIAGMDMQASSQMSEAQTGAFNTSNTSNGTPQMQNTGLEQPQQDVSNGTPQMQNVNFQHPQQRFQPHTIDPSQLHLSSPEGFNHTHYDQVGSSTPQMVHPSAQSSQFAHYAPASQFAPGSEHGTPAPSRSTPAPSACGRFQRLTPAPGAHAHSQHLTPAPGSPASGPAKVPCVNCYRHWWEDSCSAGEPCTNCTAEGLSCVRQKCFNFATGTCPKKAGTCPNVHEGDARYWDEEYLVQQEKLGVRPKRMGNQANKKVAPILRT